MHGVGALRGTGSTYWDRGQAGKVVTLWDKSTPGGRERRAGPLEWTRRATLEDQRGRPCAPRGGALGPAPDQRVTGNGPLGLPAVGGSTVSPGRRSLWVLCSGSPRAAALAAEMHVSLRGNGRQMPSPRPTWLSSGMLYTSESSSMVQALNGTAWFAMVLAARQWTRRISCSQETISFS